MKVNEVVVVKGCRTVAKAIITRWPGCSTRPLEVNGRERKARPAFFSPAKSILLYGWAMKFQLGQAGQ